MQAILGYPEAVDILIAAKVDLNLQDKIGFTALMWAVHGERQAGIEKLLAAGADLNLKSICGHTAFDLALSGNHIYREGIMTLLETEAARRKKLAEENPEPTAEDLKKMRALFDKHTPAHKK